MVALRPGWGGVTGVRDLATHPVLFDAATVGARIDALAREIRGALPEEELLLVVIAEGARRFAQALRERLNPEGRGPEPLIVRARRTRGTELRPVEVEAFELDRVRDAAVLLVDDIADEGRTLAAVREELARGHPRSVHVAVLVDKPVRRAAPIELDFIGFEIGDLWVIGYGLDVDGEFRELNELREYRGPA